jgi:hypothetical protein
MDGGRACARVSQPEDGWQAPNPAAQNLPRSELSLTSLAFYRRAVPDGRGDCISIIPAVMLHDDNRPTSPLNSGRRFFAYLVTVAVSDPTLAVLAAPKVRRPCLERDFSGSGAPER